MSDERKPYVVGNTKINKKIRDANLKAMQEQRDKKPTGKFAKFWNLVREALPIL